MSRSVIYIALYLSIRLARLKSQEYRFGCETFSSLLSSTLPLYPGLPTEQAENWSTLSGGAASVSVEIQTVPIVVETLKRIQKGTYKTLWE